MTSLEKLRKEFKLVTATFGPRERVATRWLYHDESFEEVVSLFQLKLEEQRSIYTAYCLLLEANADFDRVFKWSNALGEVSL